MKRHEREVDESSTVIVLAQFWLKSHWLSISLSNRGLSSSDLHRSASWSEVGESRWLAIRRRGTSHCVDEVCFRDDVLGDARRLPPITLLAG